MADDRNRNWGGFEVKDIVTWALIIWAARRLSEGGCVFPDNAQSNLYAPEWISLVGTEETGTYVQSQ